RHDRRGGERDARDRRQIVRLRAATPRRFRVRQSVQRRLEGKPRLSKDRAELQSGDGDGRQGDVRGGRASRGDRYARPRHHRHAGRLRGAYLSRKQLREANREAHGESAASGKVEKWKSGRSSLMDKRERIVRRIAQELHDGDYVNLGIGMPTM